MNESTRKTKGSSSMAIVEKRNQKPGGCAGILFHLFEWNRKFVKKKLFSRKLLPPARAKQVSEKFVDEKMPKSKLKLMADEKNRNHSVVEKGQKHEMKDPGLVARLMGLESMPDLKKEKVLEPFTFDANPCNGKLDSRPQKIQRTGQCDKRQLVTRFGAEALHIKTVLSRSRKHCHQLTAPSVRSPRVSLSRNLCRASRLIDAATRILEPGLQASNRARNSLTYTSSMHNQPIGDVLKDGPDFAQLPNYIVNSPNKASTGQTSCITCGNVVSRPNVEDQKVPDHPIWLVGLEMEKISADHDGGDCHEDKVNKASKEEVSFSVTKKRGQDLNQISLTRKRIQSLDKSSNLRNRRLSPSTSNIVSDSKDFVSLNRSLSGRAPMRHPPPTKVDDCIFYSKKQFNDTHDSSLSTPVRKRRTLSGVDRQTVNSCGNSTFEKPRKVKSKEMGVAQDSIKSRPIGSSYLDRPHSHNDNISFPFNSSLKYKQKRSNQVDMTSRCSGEQKKVIVDESATHAPFQKQPLLKGDALGALLELKLKELSCQDEHEVPTSSNYPQKKSTAMILQELISALTEDHPISEDSSMFNAENAFQNESTMGGACVGLMDADHLSPGSVLEVSFSTDSCASSCVDFNSSGHRLNFDSGDYYKQFQPTQRDAQVTFLNKEMMKGAETVTDIATHVSSTLNTSNLGCPRLTEKQLNHAKDVILNIELLFRTTTNPNGARDFFFGSHLLNEVESLACEVWTNINSIFGFTETKEGTNMLRGFLFNCVIELLDSKYRRYCDSGFKSYTRLPSNMNAEKLIVDMRAEIQKWTSFSAMAPDEIIEWEMSQSLGKWVDFDVEGFETGADIEMEIVQILVEEIVVDLWEINLHSF